MCGIMVRAYDLMHLGSNLSNTTVVNVHIHITVQPTRNMLFFNIANTILYLVQEESKYTQHKCIYQSKGLFRPDATASF